jgi:hypothetical protein
VLAVGNDREGERVKVTDFSNSYVTWDISADPDDRRKPGHMPWGNAVRILIDARCTIIDAESGNEVAFYLIAPCRTEWMYRETELLQDPSGEYRVIFSQDHQLFVGKSIAERGERAGPASTSVFNSLEFPVVTVPASPLPGYQDVIEATLQYVPIVARTTIEESGGLRAVLEYPVRTMNFHQERVRFQVDTGPLIFPDLEIDVDEPIERCKLAHTVYNTFNYAEFVCKRPTPLVVDHETVASTFHYSEYHRLEVKNELFAVSPTTSD